ncbi:putative quinol monooxygenase [Lysobacter sp.]|uniref:putative quinol monooxygenase n=1 Tax=Lysobacter sp. TaxID=72226 RepID=UPI002D6D54DC|nr:antibiotic biosynthesis monooxygenase [Lysobacter sp.]HZX77512.1 antibiotic biosynthesis monooxygenase [Lysobacter sp.]
MSRCALLARLEARPGKEDEVEQFLRSALPLAESEPGTRTWFALRFSPTSFGIYDTFDSEAGRQAHLDGPIAAALFAKADELLAQPPRIDRVDLLASKLPH